jgi:hypothetical protein
MGISRARHGCVSFERSSRAAVPRAGSSARSGVEILDGPQNVEIRSRPGCPALLSGATRTALGTAAPDVTRTSDGRAGPGVEEWPGSDERHRSSLSCAQAPDNASRHRGERSDGGVEKVDERASEVGK